MPTFLSALRHPLDVHVRERRVDRGTGVDLIVEFTGKDVAASHIAVDCYFTVLGVHAEMTFNKLSHMSSYC